ncbi:MAG: hypothetical protein JSW28_10155 [Thermoplasmata archaeon]|nr:MAG: hypothetical protein JSW28_10155 [Thermoplasmata archaeon]
MGLRHIWITAAVLFLLAMAVPLTSAAPKAIIYEMDVTASPAVQGRNLPIEIEWKCGWGGACCYTVYARDIEAEIFIPENVTLIEGDKKQVVTSSGQASGTVSVEPGGGLTRLSKKWVVEASEYDVYTIEVQCTGRNELGEEINETGHVNITIQPGASISKPILPRSPSIGKDIVIVAEVTSSDSTVKSVSLYHSKDQENWVQITMGNTEGDAWMGTVPSQEKEGEVYYYLESIDENDKTFTTEVYSLQVRDMDKIGTVTLLSTYGTLLAFIIGTVAIFMFNRRLKTPTSKSGMTILGASLRLSALRGLDEITDDQEKMKKLRTGIALALLIAVIILLVLGIYTGQLQEVISHTTNPSEA